MKIVILSDTHGMHFPVKVPDGDILIYCGDFCNWGVKDEVKSFNKWLSSLPHARKIVIAGNHDICLDPDCDDPRTGNKKYNGHELIGNADYLENESIEIEGIKFWGSPYTPTFLNWAFMKDDSDLAEIWSKIPEDIDVLITHGPAYGILDATPRGENVGSKSLLKRIEELKSLKYHLFGHIHGCYGVYQAKTYTPIFINASVCTEAYKPVNEPVVIEI